MGEKIKAVFISDARCHGAGSNRYKWVSGVARHYTAGEIPEGLAVLVRSHTQFDGQCYKLAIRFRRNKWAHRQINDSDYEIVKVI